MKIKNAFQNLTRFEWGLWLTSVTVIIISSLLIPQPDVVSMIASFIGVTALIFVAKGYVLGQILCIIFAVFYGIVSFYARYYGEMITYLGMSAPAALFATISWIRNPYKKTAEVKIARLTRGKLIMLCVAAGFVTFAFYHILGALGTANVMVSTISVSTSFFASMLLIFRNPMYALAYALNDIVLITLWIMAAFEDPSSAPMIACFVMFFVNDMYGFIQWSKRQKRQEADD
jgi:nicotinamide mononucleotide transporter PnuC